MSAELTVEVFYTVRLYWPLVVALLYYTCRLLSRYCLNFFITIE